MLITYQPTNFLPEKVGIGLNEMIIALINELKVHWALYFEYICSWKDDKAHGAMFCKIGIEIYRLFIKNTDKESNNAH